MLKRLFLSMLAAGLATPEAWACEAGLYRSPDGEMQAAVVQPAGGPRYTLADGRRGALGAPDALLRCEEGRIVSGGSPWQRVSLRLTATRFASHGQQLAGVLIEPPEPAAATPLVVLVHGSERTSPMTGAYPYILAAHGLRVFAYDKRGTGQSEGDYTQNFELLADDAGAALAEARRLAQGRFTRIGYYGGSQGGWVAPLAATRSKVDFVAVGFGLMLTPAEEDREQVLTELRERGASGDDLAAAREITDATALLVSSHFERGYAELAEARRRHGHRPWFGTVRGEYTGEILASSEAELRRVGRARFDNLELSWDYDAVGTLRRLRAPLLWVIAEADREAPPGVTRDRLTTLRDEGAAIDLYSFPDTDHGMVEFVQQPDGTRRYGRITEGYFRLLADWIAGAPRGTYGRARRH